MSKIKIIELLMMLDKDIKFVKQELSQVYASNTSQSLKYDYFVKVSEEINQRIKTMNRLLHECDNLAGLCDVESFTEENNSLDEIGTIIGKGFQIDKEEFERLSKPKKVKLKFDDFGHVLNVPSEEE